MIIRGNLDLEWKMLILEAKNLGLTVGEIREFFHNKDKEAR